MDRHMAKIKRVLSPGLENRYTYLSTQLPKFILNCLHSLKEFNRICIEIKSVNFNTDISSE